MTSYQTRISATVNGNNTNEGNSLKPSNSSLSPAGDVIRVGTPSNSNRYESGLESTHAPPASPALGSRILGPCAECGLRIVNLQDACHAMGYLYHNACFVCCCCKRTLRGKVFYKDQEKIYCEEDYLFCGFQQTVEKCSACGHIISETILLALGNAYHPDCFQCCVCTECLDGIPFTVDDNNMIYCLRDYYLVHGPLCGLCGLVIMPEDGTNEVKRVVALGKEFHLDCYRCLDCKRSLGDEPEKRCYPYSEPDPGAPGRFIQRLLCLSCHLQRIGAVPATSAGGVSTTISKTSSGLISHLNNSSSRYSATNTNRLQCSKLKSSSSDSPLVQSASAPTPYQSYKSPPYIRSTSTNTNVTSSSSSRPILSTAWSNPRTNNSNSNL